MRRTSLSPWIYVPTLYFVEGLPYVFVNSVSIYYFKGVGLSNEFIGWASILMLPWVLKLFWAPMVDMISVKRNWVVAMQAAVALGLGGTAYAAAAGSAAAAVTAMLFVTAFASATHDVAADGYYLLALDAPRQALFVGIRSTAYRIAMLAGGGAAAAAGLLQQSGSTVASSWATVYGGAALLFFAAALFHGRFLPRVEERPDPSEERPSFGQAFRTYFAQPRILPVLLFILLYRLGEALLTRMAAPFLLDSFSDGGLQLTTAQAALLRDVLGQTGLIVGGICGGWLISRWGLRRCMLPMALALNLPDLGYWYMAVARPGVVVTAALVLLEQVGYGFGFTSFMVFLMTFTKGRYKTSHYALSTGLMAVGMMLPGMISGTLQQMLGYPAFFLLVTALTIPGMVLIRFLPLPPHPEKES